MFYYKNYLNIKVIKIVFLVPSRPTPTPTPHQDQDQESSSIYSQTNRKRKIFEGDFCRFLTRKIPKTEHKSNGCDQISRNQLIRQINYCQLYQLKGKCIFSRRNQKRGKINQIEIFFSIQMFSQLSLTFFLVELWICWFRGRRIWDRYF